MYRTMTSADGRVYVFHFVHVKCHIFVQHRRFNNLNDVLYWLLLMVLRI